MRIWVHPRIMTKHPEITADDVAAAFADTLASRRRDTDPVQVVGVGIDGKGRLLQYITVEDAPGAWQVFHAMGVTKGVLRELGLGGK